MDLITTTAPQDEPVTTEEIKDHLRVSTSDDDAYIASLAIAARQHIEALTGFRLFTQTLTLYADKWTDYPLVDPNDDTVLLLRVAPVQSITTVKYYDTDDVLTTISSADYWEDLNSVPCRLQTKTSWPEAKERIGAIQIAMQSGWSDIDNVPEHFGLAIRLLVEHWYDNRMPVSEVKMTEIPFGITSILTSHPEYHHWQL